MEKHTWNKDWPCACILLVIRWWSQRHYSSQTTACASDEVLSGVVQAPRWCRGFELAMKCLATCCSAPVPLLLRSTPPPPHPPPKKKLPLSPTTLPFPSSPPLTSPLPSHHTPLLPPTMTTLLLWWMRWHMQHLDLVALLQIWWPPYRIWWTL